MAASERGSIGRGGEELAEQLRRQKLTALGAEIKVAKPDAAADALAERLGGRSRIRFADDPSGREYDTVTDHYIGQTTTGTSISQHWRHQAQATFQAAKSTGRRPYFHFTGPPSTDHLAALERYRLRYGVDPVIDTVPFEG
jgi:hypothetical protein